MGLTMLHHRDCTRASTQPPHTPTTGLAIDILDEKHTHDSTNAYNHLSTHTLADDDKNYSSENHRVVVVVVRVVMAADPDIIYNPPNGQNGELPQGFCFPVGDTQHTTQHTTPYGIDTLAKSKPNNNQTES